MNQELKISIDIHQILLYLGIDKQKFQAHNVQIALQSTTPTNAQPLQRR